MLQKKIEKEYKYRENRGGNYCFHERDNPRLIPMEPLKTGKGGMPRIITLFSERVQQYYSRPSIFPTLTKARGSSRLKRSERREAIVIALATLSKFFDLVTAKIGFNHGDVFQNVTVPFLADHAGISTARMSRAISDLRRAGFLTVKQIVSFDNGEYKSVAAVKCLNEAIFGALGLASMLKIERKKASARLRKREANQLNNPKHLSSTAWWRGKMSSLAISAGLADSAARRKARPAANDSVKVDSNQSASDRAMQLQMIEIAARFVQSGQAANNSIALNMAADALTGSG